MDPDHQVMLGLYGAIVVKSANLGQVNYAQDKVWMLSEWRVNYNNSNLPIQGAIASMPMEGMFPNFFTINGKAFDPVNIAAESIVTLHAGERARISLINMGQAQHTMHMHGRNFFVIARDSVSLPWWQRQEMNTIVLNPGEIVDIEFQAGGDVNDQGLWVFHCHVLHHSTNDHAYPGGMVTAINIIP